MAYGWKLIYEKVYFGLKKVVEEEVSLAAQGGENAIEEAIAFWKNRKRKRVCMGYKLRKPRLKFGKKTYKIQSR